MMTIRPAGAGDLDDLAALDGHIPVGALTHAVAEGRVLVALEDGRLIGCLRWGFFWDSVPFLNLLFVAEGRRGQGVGRQLMARWEALLRQDGHPLAMTSTASDETAQHFYHRLGYETVGGFFYQDDPYELMLAKRLTS